MLNKIVLLICILLIYLNVNAQKIVLVRNGTLETKSFKVKKRLILFYIEDGKKIKLKKRAFKYEFPYLFYKAKGDTQKIDVRKIEKVKFNSPFKFVAYPLGGIFGLYTIAFSTLIFDEDARYGALILAPITGYLSYTLITNSQKIYNTKEKWSFVKQKKDTLPQ